MFASGLFSFMFVDWTNHAVPVGQKQRKPDVKTAWEHGAFDDGSPETQDEGNAQRFTTGGTAGRFRRPLG